MPDFEEMAAKHVVYAVPGMDAVSVRKHILYKTTDDIELRLDIYSPHAIEPGVMSPAVILVHGNPPAEYVMLSKEVSMYVDYGRLIAASGLVAVMFNHRSSEGFVKIAEATSDVDDLLDYVREHSEELGIDRDRIGVWAFSSGTSYGLRAALYDIPAYIRCIVSYYGYLSPQENPRIAPLFVAKAGADHPFVNQSIDQFVQLASTSNLALTFMNHPTGLHAFDILNDDRRSREIIRATLAFLRTHLLADNSHM